MFFWIETDATVPFAFCERCFSSPPSRLLSRNESQQRRARHACPTSTKSCRHLDDFFALLVTSALRILTPPMETPDPPNDIPGALKQVVLTPHDIPDS